MWEKHVSKKSGKTYYFNRATGQSVYERPADYESSRKKADGGSGDGERRREKRKHGDGGGGGGSSASGKSRDGKHRDSGSDEGGDAKRAAKAKGAGKTLTTAHILVKHTKSRKPKSWRSPDGILRPPAEARTKAERLLAKLKTYDAEQLPRCFTKVAQRDSDCSSAKHGGNLGEWTTGQKKFMPAFEAGAAPLAVGELSDIVESASGFHIILRTK